MLDKLPIRQLPIKKLRRDPSIKHSVDDIKQIIASTKILKSLPLLIDNHRNILLGHGRLAAAMTKGAFQVGPCESGHLGLKRVFDDSCVVAMSVFLAARRAWAQAVASSDFVTGPMAVNKDG